MSEGTYKKSWSQRLMALTLVGSMGLGLQSCTNEEIAIGAGIIGIAAGAIAIGAAIDNNRPHHPHHPHRPGYHRPPGHYYGPGGHYYYQPGRPHRPGHHRPWGVNFQSETLAEASAKDSALQQERKEYIQDFAAAFEIPEASAARLVFALDQLRTGNAAAFQALGLSNQDLTKLATLNLPSGQGLHKMAGQLGLTQSETVGVFNSLIEAAQTDLQNSDGRIWRDCRAAGTWRTPQNAVCTASDQSGCSIETGATACLPVLSETVGT